MVGVVRTGYILKKDLIRFADSLDMEYEKKRTLKNGSKVFGLRNWQDGRSVLY